jgi:hypothetical protein
MARLPAILIGLFLIAGPIAGIAAKDAPCEFENVRRIVAVGDVHGAYDNLIVILRAAGVVDDKGRWTGGNTHLVQVGDVVDRGADSRKAIDLYRRLDREASRAGGRVHYLLGNHEALRLLGDVRYTTAGEFAAFATRSSADVRRALAERVAPAERDAILARPLGMIELNDAFAPDGDYGSYLLSLNAVVRINDIVFLHGGISPAFAARSCGDINASIRRELGTDQDRTLANQKQSLSTREDGPLWYRGYATEADAFRPAFDAILAAQHAQAFVVGHTPRPESRIVSRFGGRVFMLDTGMQTGYVAGGRPSALEVSAGAFTAIYPDSRTPVPAAGPVLISSDAPNTETR